MDLGEKFVIRSNSLDPKQGNILISEPLMNDFHFGRSVILLIDHEEAEGSFGVIINKTLNTSVNQIVDDFPEFDAPVYLGGPVSDNQLFFTNSTRPSTLAAPFPTTNCFSSTPSATSSPTLAPLSRACIGAARWKHSKP